MLTESCEGLGVRVAKVAMLSLMESDEASFRRERFFIMPLKKLSEFLPLRGSPMDMSDTEGTRVSLVNECVSLGRERTEAVEVEGRLKGMYGNAGGRLWGWGGERGYGRRRRCARPTGSGQGTISEPGCSLAGGRSGRSG